MTLTDLKDEVVYLIGGEEVNLMTIYKFVNKAMDTLANRYDTACTKKTASVVCTDCADEYSLPADCIGVYKVENSSGDKYKAYLISDGSISFGYTDTFSLGYYAIPTMTTRTATDTAIKTDTLPINSNFNKCIAKYIAGEVLKIYNPKDVRISVYTDDFIQEAKEADARLKRMKRKNMRIKAPYWG